MARPPLPTLGRPGDKSSETDFEELKRRIHSKLVDKLDLTRVGELEGDVLRREIRMVRIQRIGRRLRQGLPECVAVQVPREENARHHQPRQKQHQ